MNFALLKPMTRQGFLAWAETQPQRYEFDGLAPVAMTGGNAIHDRLRRRLHRLLEDRLDGKPCEPFGPDLGITTVGDAIRYPDALVTCTAVDDKSRLAADPVVVFEILSPGSSQTDRIVKAREYQAIASLRRYIIIEQDSIACTMLAKDGDGTWRFTVLTGNDSVELPEIGIGFPLAELYAGTALAGTATRRRPGRGGRPFP